MSEIHTITDEAALKKLFGAVSIASIKKEVNTLHPYYRAMIAASPFFALATSGADGLDVSPRGDPAGFVHVLDERTLLMPERRGNNRIDSLRNIIHDPRVALLFLIPGINETLRVNGNASITTDPTLLQQFVMNDKLPICVVRVQVETVFFQCARALIRSQLWDATRHIDRSVLPGAGALLCELSNGEIDAETYDRDAPARQLATLY